jgi:hypothetical protein
VSFKLRTSLCHLSYAPLSVIQALLLFTSPKLCSNVCDLSYDPMYVI